MFGLSIDKLIVVALVIAVILGPERLPHYASMLGRVVRSLRALTEGAKSRMSEELGTDLDAEAWKRLDPRRYDPRQIMREALAAPGVAAGAPDTAAPPPESSVPDEIVNGEVRDDEVALEPAMPAPLPKPRYSSSGRVIREE
ncbi:twin-arginine translocase TatA/TatE family subunit [Agromyces atrinae]|uniref:Sec-independent protein translocase TatB n=1 Tax=Agromyces atrinae TaxID=592376 RepID=A0A4Q2M6A0_9MICO|nr:twin-arginine translocase TatA/TatE family subunit [Agromyces atrinae]NYD68142.1 Sec-independent protein translocase protein TatA [Agromyces atrinae]RXZ87714.1 Sec-independent protein translocase TatB [Agromyces atrinae]